MDESGIAILNNSNRIISRLQLLSAFFGDDILYRIYLRTQVIHQLFHDNPELDINQLDLFHLQFTQTLIELLRKIKKNNEQSVLILLDEMQLNKDLIEKVKSSIVSAQEYKLDQERQTLKVDTSLRKLYQALSDDSAQYPFSKNINAFGAKYSADFFQDTDKEVMAGMMQYNPAEVYTNAFAVIHRKLMGALCKYDFRSSFICGLKAGGTVAEVYQVTGSDKYYAYFPAKGMFLFCDISQIKTGTNGGELSKKEGLIRELTDKNDQLNSTISTVKTTLPADIKQLLTENYKKINDINFLQNISSVDVQSNMLKAMLNTDMI